MPRRTLSLAVLAVAISLAVVSSASAGAPLSLAPADGDRYVATATGGIAFTVVGAPHLSPVHVVVARTGAAEPSERDIVDFVGLTASLAEPGTYRGLSSIGGWASEPGTYFWQARVAGAPLGPVRRLVVTAPEHGMPVLRKREGRRAARTHLRRSLRSYRRGSHRRMRCARVSRMHVRCRVSWRFRDLRYAGSVDVTADSHEELVAQSRIRRRT